MNFDLSGFLPHGVCFAGRPDLILLHVASDAVIAIAYFMIPLTLVYFLRRKGLSSLSFNWALALFAAFILLCGSGHVLDILVIWSPMYYLQGVWKAATALVSIITALAILPLVPRLLSMRTPEELEAVNRELQQANQQLQAEVAARQAAEAGLKQSLAETRRAADELEQFAYIASHDLQAPLRNIAGFAQLLERRYRPQLEGDGLEFLDFIGKGVGSMQSLIQDLLQLSRVGRVDAGAFVSRSLRHSVDQALTALDGAVQRSGAKVQIGTLPDVIADHALLTQLFQNLIANAIKFQRPGSVPVVEIGAEGEGENWHVQVRDNGIGIAAEHLETIFAIFRRLHVADEYEGTGIGLALVRKIVAYHGGRISAKSAGEGEGSTFHIWLPKNPVMREARSEAQAPVL